MSRRSGVNEAFGLNIKTQNFHSMKMKLLAINSFKWEGLPEGIPERFIEETLYNYGIVAFAHDEKYGLICCKCNIDGTLNMYDEGRRYHLYASNGYSKIFKREEIVLIRNNKMELPTAIISDYYIKKFVEIDRAIDTNVIMQKTSKILLCDESQRLTLTNLLMQHEGNVPFIFGNTKMDLKTFETLDLNADYVADKLQELSNDKWREWLDTVGINNANTTKRERLISDEVNSNNQLLELASDSFLESRQIAVNEINEKWGLDISVERRVAQETIVEYKEGDF